MPLRIVPIPPTKFTSNIFGLDSWHSISGYSNMQDTLIERFLWRDHEERKKKGSTKRPNTQQTDVREITERMFLQAVVGAQ